MRVLMNQSTALGARTGVGRYASELLRALAALAPENSFDAFPPSWWASIRRLGSSLRPASGVRTAGGESSWRESLLKPMRMLGERALQGYLRWTTRGRRYDLYHEPNHVPLTLALPTVATVHDLSVLLYPHWHPADRVAVFERDFERGVKRCRHLLAVSEFTRQEMIRVLNVPAERITCTYNGVRADLRPMPREEAIALVGRLGLPANYLLFVGTIEPRKNPLLLMRAYGALPAEVRGRCPLVLAGAWGWNAVEFADYYHAEAKHRGVVHLGYVPDRDLPALYGAARALVFPSHYEGFGLPPLEMMACGGAVLTSKAGAVVEVVGKSGHTIAADDFDGWRDAMQRVIVDDDWRRELCRGAVDRAAEFTWQRCAEQTLDVYRAVLRLPAAQSRAA